jgi:DNA-binding MarR family transcriptional regulator
VSSLATAYESSGDSPGLLLWQVTNRWQSAVRAALKPHDLTHVQFVLLASLTWLSRGGPVTQRQLADHAATDPMMTSQVVRTLEAKGLLRRDTDPNDGRAKALTVTETGAAAANRAVVAVEACDRAFFGSLGGQLPVLVASLAVLAKAEI